MDFLREDKHRHLNKLHSMTRRDETQGQKVAVKVCCNLLGVGKMESLYWE